jgi:hypothetical protein
MDIFHSIGLYLQIVSISKPPTVQYISRDRLVVRTLAVVTQVRILVMANFMMAKKGFLLIYKFFNALFSTNIC